MEQFGLRLNDILEKRRQELSGVQEQERLLPFGNENETDQQQRREAVFKDDTIKAFFYFAKTYYPEYVTSPFAEFHYQLVSYANRAGKEFHLIAAPPEHGKSIIMLLWKVFCAITGRRHMHAQIGENKDLAAINLSWVMQEFQMNPRILYDYGFLLHPVYQSRYFFSVQNYDIDGTQKQADNPYTSFKAFGYQTALRGYVFYQYRIDSVEFDDFEPIHASKNKALVDERINWIFSEVQGRVAKHGCMYWIHNNSRKGSAADRLHAETSRANVYSHKYPALIDGRPLWPQRYSVEYLHGQKQQVGYITWQGDWMQRPVVGGKIFKPEWVRTFTHMPSDLIIISRIDFSPGASKSASYKAMPFLGWSPSTKKFYVLDAWVRQDTINRLIDAIYYKYQLWEDRNLYSIKIESDFRQDIIYSPYFQQKAEEYGWRVPVGLFENKGRGDKDARVARMESPMQLGIILFPEGYEKDPDLNELVSHLLAWDYGSTNKGLDGADALASCYIDLERLARSYARSAKQNYIQVEPNEPRTI